MRIRILLLVVVAGVAFWLGRQTLPELRDRLLPPTPHERYGRRLEAAGLDDAALGRLWRLAARRSLTEAPAVSAPFREVGYLEPGRPGAVGYRFDAREGVRLRVELALDPPSNALIFLDVFRARPEDAGPPVHVVSADSGSRALAFEPDRDGEYVVRVQPELLRGGRYTLTVTAEPTLSFPVHQDGQPRVRSFFGDPRDGGSRDHHGIDIFAPRGTPVVAAASGRVSRVRSTPIGGRVVWLRDEERGQALYYAHLEEQWVEDGQRVRPGDTLGLVGNSGNARGTPPHLHFGIYRRGRGPLDPLPFVAARPSVPPAPALPAAAVAGVRRVAEDGTRLRAAPREDGEVRGQLERDTPVRVVAVAGPWLRVAVADGRRGFVAARLTTPASPLRAAAVDSSAPLRAAPMPNAPEVGRLEPGERVEVLGQLRGHLYVRARGREAWLQRGLAP